MGPSASVGASLGVLITLRSAAPKTSICAREAGLIPPTRPAQTRYAPNTLCTSRSISLMPTNGRIMPPSP